VASSAPGVGTATTCGCVATASTSSGASAAESTRSAVDARVEITMHRQQPAPLVGSAPLAEDAADRMTCAAERVRFLVSFVGEIDQTAFGLEHHRSCFFGRKSVRIRERLDHAACDFGSDLNVVERDHPPDRQF